jgi:diaminobutyrate-2-oxoglutarate transaminase
MEVFERWESDIRGYCRTYPTVFKSASNARQVDENGKSYIDFFAGAGVLNFGHNNPNMKQALIDYIQSDGVAHSLDLYTTAKRSFIEKFVGTILEPRGWDYKLQFMGPTGTNAVELALKLARKVTGRRSVVAYTHGFHGMTLGSLACTSNSYFRNAAGVPLEHVVHQPFGCRKTCLGCELGCGLESVDRLRALFENPSSGWEPPAAFLVEAIQAEGGVKVASKEWLQATQKLAKDLGALFIIDDIQAGCGRTGNYFSFDGMGLEHDRHWKPGEHTGTFRGQGLSFVAGVEGLKYFDDDKFLEEVREKGKHIREHVEKLCGSLSGVTMQARGEGMMQALDTGDPELAKTITAKCFEAGLIITQCGVGGRVLKIIPPLTIPQEDLQEGLDILSEAVAQTVEVKAA